MQTGHDAETLTLHVALDPEELADGLVLDGPDELGRQLLEKALSGCRECFTRQASPRGVEWEALMPATQRKRGRGGPIGIVTGALSGGLWYDLGEAAINLESATWRYARAPLGKARAFNRGNERTGQVARPFLGWTPDATRAAQAILERARHERRGLGPFEGDSPFREDELFPPPEG